MPTPPRLQGDRPEFSSPLEALTHAFGLLTASGGRAGISVAAEAYTLRCLGPIGACEESFIRTDLEGRAAYCRFLSCGY